MNCSRRSELIRKHFKNHVLLRTAFARQKVLEDFVFYHKPRDGNDAGKVEDDNDDEDVEEYSWMELVIMFVVASYAIAKIVVVGVVLRMIDRI